MSVRSDKRHGEMHNADISLHDPSSRQNSIPLTSAKTFRDIHRGRKVSRDHVRRHKRSDSGSDSPIAEHKSIRPNRRQNQKTENKSHKSKRSDSESNSPIVEHNRHKHNLPRPDRRHHQETESSDAQFGTPYNKSSRSQDFHSEDNTHSEPMRFRRSEEQRHKHKKNRKHHEKRQTLKRSPQIYLEYKEREREVRSSSLVDKKHSKDPSRHRRRRSTSIEVQFEPSCPCPRVSRRSRPCHTDWSQSYDPKQCASGASSGEIPSEKCCIIPEKIYCPEPRQNSGESLISVEKKLRQGYIDDKPLRTDVTITEKHRQNNSLDMENFRNHRDKDRADNEGSYFLDRPKVGNDFQGYRTDNGGRDRSPPREVRKNKSASGVQANHFIPGPSKPSKSAKLKMARAAAGLRESAAEGEHIFPFVPTISGNVKVKPEQISYENKKVAVLVSDLKHTFVNVKQQEIKSNGEPDDSRKSPPGPTVPMIPDDDSEDESPTRTDHASAGRHTNNDGKPPRRPKYSDDDFGHRSSGSDTSGRHQVIHRMVQTTSDLEKGGKHSYGDHSDDDSGDVKEFMDNLHYRMKRAINPDMIIRVGGSEFPCHAIALHCYSKFLDKKHRHRDQMMEFEISERIITAKEFRNLMDWVLISKSYKKSVITKDNVVGLYSGSVYLDIPALRNDCLDFVKEKLQEEDPAIVQLYEDAVHKENSQALVALLSTKLSVLFPKLYKSKQFLQMGVNELLTLLKSDNIKIKSELDVYDAAARWLLFDWPNRSQHTLQVMRTVRFGLLTPLQIMQIRHSAEDASMPEYAKIYSFPEVRKLLDEGLSYAVFRDSYKDKPGELNRWVEKSDLTPPTSRYNLEQDPDIHRMPARISFLMEDGDGDSPRIEHQHHQSLKRMSSVEDVSNYQEQKHRTNEVHVENIGYKENVQHEENFYNNTFEEKEPSASAFTRRKSSGGKDYLNFNQNKKQWKEHLSPAELRMRAIVLIQAAVRSWLTRRWYKRLKYAVIRIQIWFRARRRRMHERKKYTPQNVGTGMKHLTLQKHYIANTPHVKRLTLDHSAVIIIIGGFDPTRDVSDDNNASGIYQLDMMENVWALMGHLPEPRIHGGAVLHRDVIIVFGGADPRYRNSNERLIPTASTCALDIQSGKWKKLSDMQTARRNFGYATAFGKIFVFGGVDEDGNTLASSEAYDPDYNAWSYIQPMDGPRTAMGVVKHNGQIWLAGGMAKFQTFPILTSVITYNIKQNKFFPAPSLPQAICYPSMASYHGELFLIGGAGRIKSMSKAQSLATILKYDDGQWKVLTQLKSPRHSHIQVNIGRYVALIGGISSAIMSALDTAEVFNMEKKTTKTTIAPMPLKLSGLSGVMIP